MRTYIEIQTWKSAGELFRKQNNRKLAITIAFLRNRDTPFLLSFEFHIESTDSLKNKTYLVGARIVLIEKIHFNCILILEQIALPS